LNASEVVAALAIGRIYIPISAYVKHIFWSRSDIPSSLPLHFL
jgi:hypothetical protein